MQQTNSQETPQSNPTQQEVPPVQAAPSAEQQLDQRKPRPKRKPQKKQTPSNAAAESAIPQPGGPAVPPQDSKEDDTPPPSAEPKVKAAPKGNPQKRTRQKTKPEAETPNVDQSQETRLEAVERISIEFKKVESALNNFLQLNQADQSPEKLRDLSLPMSGDEGLKAQIRRIRVENDKYISERFKNAAPSEKNQLKKKPDPELASAIALKEKLGKTLQSLCDNTEALLTKANALMQKQKSEPEPEQEPEQERAEDGDPRWINYKSKVEQLSSTINGKDGLHSRLNACYSKLQNDTLSDAERAEIPSLLAEATVVLETYQNFNMEAEVQDRRNKIPDNDAENSYQYWFKQSGSRLQFAPQTKRKGKQVESLHAPTAIKRLVEGINALLDPVNSLTDPRFEIKRLEYELPIFFREHTVVNKGILDLAWRFETMTLKNVEVLSDEHLQRIEALQPFMQEVLRKWKTYRHTARGLGEKVQEFVRDSACRPGTKDDRMKALKARLERLLIRARGAFQMRIDALELGLAALPAEAEQQRLEIVGQINSLKERQQQATVDPEKEEAQRRVEKAQERQERLLELKHKKFNQDLEGLKKQIFVASDRSPDVLKEKVDSGRLNLNEIFDVEPIMQAKRFVDRMVQEYQALQAKAADLAALGREVGNRDLEEISSRINELCTIMQDIDDQVEKVRGKRLDALQPDLEAARQKEVEEQRRNAVEKQRAKEQAKAEKKLAQQKIDEALAALPESEQSTAEGKLARRKLLEQKAELQKEVDSLEDAKQGKQGGGEQKAKKQDRSLAEFKKYVDIFVKNSNDICSVLSECTEELLEAKLDLQEEENLKYLNTLQMSVEAMRITTVVLNGLARDTAEKGAYYLQATASMANLAGSLEALKHSVQEKTGKMLHVLVAEFRYAQEIKKFEEKLSAFPVNENATQQEKLKRSELLERIAVLKQQAEQKAISRLAEDLPVEIKRLETDQEAVERDIAKARPKDAPPDALDLVLRDGGGDDLDLLDWEKVPVENTVDPEWGEAKQDAAAVSVSTRPTPGVQIFQLAPSARTNAASASTAPPTKEGEASSATVAASSQNPGQPG